MSFDALMEQADADVFEHVGTAWRFGPAGAPAELQVQGTLEDKEQESDAGWTLVPVLELTAAAFARADIRAGHEAVRVSDGRRYRIISIRPEARGLREMEVKAVSDD